MSARTAPWFALLAAASAVGCGEEARESSRVAAAANEALQEKLSELNTLAATGGDAVEWADADGSETTEDQPAEARPAGVKPRIIYTADVALVVDDFAAAEAAIPALIDRLGGYAASVDVDRSSGNRLRGTWVARVPVTEYEAFLAGTAGLGVVERIDQQARDVTAEFVDTEARLASRKTLEERLLGILADRPGKLTDVLEVERELARVRGELEQAEGRLRYLSNQTAFSTVTLNVREERDYEPPQAPTFGENIRRVWSDSLDALAAFGRGLVLFAVAATPWLVALGIPAVLCAWVLWRAAKRAVRRVTRRTGPRTEPYVPPTEPHAAGAVREERDG